MYRTTLVTCVVGLLCVGFESQADDSKPRFGIDETPTAIVMKHNGRPVFRYNKVSPTPPKGIDPIYRRSGFIHPVQTPSGQVVTGMFPVDHPHQHGIFSAWVNTEFKGKKVDFWNLAAGKARVAHEKVISKSKSLEGSRLEVTLLHQVVGKTPVNVLRERWVIQVKDAGAEQLCFDLDSTQEAIGDHSLLVKKYHYGGIALRGPIQWLLPKDRYLKESPNLKLEPNRFINAQGSDRKKGNHEHTKWVSLSGQVNGKPATITVLSHPSNFRSPQAARLHPTKPYFCFACCVDGDFTIDAKHPLRSRYRFLTYDRPVDQKWIAKQWDAWVQEEKSNSTRRSEPQD